MHKPPEPVRVVGLVAVAGGSVSPVGTAGQLRAVVRALGGLTAPNELLVNRVGTFADGLLGLTERRNPQPPGLEVGVAG